MDLYEILLQRIVLLTDEYLQLKERVKELENETRIDVYKRQAITGRKIINAL